MTTLQERQWITGGVLSIVSVMSVGVIDLLSAEINSCWYHIKCILSSLNKTFQIETWNWHRAQNSVFYTTNLKIQSLQ